MRKIIYQGTYYVVIIFELFWCYFENMFVTNGLHDQNVSLIK